MSVINTNVKSLVAQESMRASNMGMSQAMERLSTGSKINNAKDDAAGLAITNRMTAQIRGMAKAIVNVNDAISMTQTAEGALGNVTDVLQRMRELAVQSVNGTNNANDRASLQLEVSQLKAQIDEIAKSTNHNNIKLLDGTAQNIVIQTGVNSGNSTKLGFDSVKTKDIGIGTRASLSSVGGTYTDGTNFSALSAGSLMLNGVLVGPSLAADDQNSPVTAAAASAIAKAAAINKVADTSGVYAKATSTFVSGAKQTAAALSGTITINGYTSVQFSTISTDAAASRKAAVDAINAMTGSTGVTAIDSGDSETGVSLVAADGRNIVIAFTTMTSAASGVAAASTNVGSFSLFAMDGRDINVNYRESTTGNDVENQIGLRAGTYKADQALFTTYKRTDASAAPVSDTQGFLYGNSLIINGVAIGAALVSDDTASQGASLGPLSSTKETTAIAIAAAINKKTAQTGVTATAAPNIIRGEGYTVAASSQSVYLNGVTITVNTQTRDGTINSINSVSGLTGVVASAFGAGIQYTAADGRNINIGSSGGADALGLTGITIGANALSASAVTFLSQVTLSSDNAFEIKAGSHGITNLEKLGFRQGTYGGTEGGLKINQVDISTIAGANTAIAAVDAAMNTVNASLARTGAINNRLDAVISNLVESSKNMQASRSRILDTDYAVETTNLAKQQIITQAATAMLAQANQSSQSILSLLK